MPSQINGLTMTTFKIRFYNMYTDNSLVVATHGDA